MEHKLLKNWKSKRHGKILLAGLNVNITKQKELTELIDLGCIDAPKEIKKENKKSK